MKIFETERLILRRFHVEDWKDLFEYLSKESVVKYEPYHTFTEDESRKEALRRAGDEAFWAVCIMDNKKVIGNIYFQHQEPKDFMTWEIGYLFNPSFYGNGYATEACSTIIDYAFKNLQARRVVAMCNPLNVSSWRLLERLNMRREGHLIKNVYFKRDKHDNPVWNDTYEYAILKEEWRS